MRHGARSETAQNIGRLPPAQPQATHGTAARAGGGLMERRSRADREKRRRARSLDTCASGGVISSG
jgi:hypothetical protein